MRYLTYSLFVLFSLLYSRPNQAQTAVDSLRDIWTNSNKADSIRFAAINKFYLANTQASPDASLEVISYHYDLAKSKGFLKEMANAKVEQSFVYYLKGKLDLSMKSLIKVENLLLEMGDTLQAGRIYNNKGNLYLEQQKYSEAIREYFKALDVFEANGLRKVRPAILNNLGLIYYYIDDHALALEYFNKALKGLEEVNEIERTGLTWNHIASVNNKLKKYDQALEDARKGIAISKKHNDNIALSEAHLAMAISFQALHQLDSAFHYIEKSIAFNQSIQNENKILSRQLLKAELQFEKNIDLAFRSAENILKQINQTTPNFTKKGVYELLYKCYKEQGKTDLSLVMLEKRNLYVDSLAIEKNKNEIIREAIQKNFEIKMNEAAFENEQEREKLKTAGLNKILLLGLISGLTILGLLFFQRKKNRQNQLEKEALLKELETLKNVKQSDLVVESAKFELNREKIEAAINRKINETDWKVLNILLDDPVSTNKEIAQKAFMSVDGIGSSLIRMYAYFDVKKSKYKKISLLMDAIKISNKEAT